MTENVQVGTRLLFENERIRVWDITLEPGERLPFHRRRAHARKPGHSSVTRGPPAAGRG